MSHSVVKVTDAVDNDSLLLLVGEDGTVTPDKETVKSFLSSKTGSTNIQLLHINKLDGKSIDVSIDNLTYVPDNDINEVTVVTEPTEPNAEPSMDQIAHNLYSFKLDHDYTPLTSPTRPVIDDELAQTLGILEGTIDTGPPELLLPPPLVKSPKVIKTIPKLTPMKPLTTAITPVSTTFVFKIASPVVAKQTLIGPTTSVPIQLTPVSVAPVPATHPSKVTASTPAAVSKLTLSQSPMTTRMVASIVTTTATPTLPPLIPTSTPLTSTSTPLTSTSTPLTSASTPLTSTSTSLTSTSTPLKTPTTTRNRPKVITTQKQTKTPVRQPKIKPKIVEEIEEEEEYEDEVDFNFEYIDDENDSDFEIEEVVKRKPPRRASKRQAKAETPKPAKTQKTPTRPKPEKQHELEKHLPEKQAEKYHPEKHHPEKLLEPETSRVEKPADQPPPEQKPPQSVDEHTLPPAVEQKPPEKKPPKKEKKPPKPILDDFALFSTPDIIRRVGGKDPVTPTTPSSHTPTTPISAVCEIGNVSKPAKISQENRSKSTSETSLSPPKSNRLSLDSKVGSSEKDKHSNHHKSSSEAKHKDRRVSTEGKAKRNSTEEAKRNSTDENKIHKASEKTHHSESKKSLDHGSSKASSSHSSHHVSSSDASTENLGHVPIENINELVTNEPTKPFTSHVPMDVAPELNTSEQQSLDHNNMNLDTEGLEIDQNLLDNIGNDIPDDILYQVAQSLVNNTDLQKALDKSINEGNLVLDPSIQQAIQQQDVISQNQPTIEQKQSADFVQQGTQIVRPDGRIVVIPPIERPTTRSRNKRKEVENPVFKPVHKPLDDEHVSGNELDSSDDEEESEDDPNKLWCICNQPHNNRFMICCDTCEEWYHGKCVNITKTMGQQMEAEGKEWICLFCKDASLKRPQAAARRIRKASRASRASTDSTGSSKKGSESGSTSFVPCVVCQKPSRKNSIFCSEACILAHAHGVEKVVVFERATGKMLTGNKAPTAANLEQWLEDHPGYEVVRSTGNVVTAKAPQFTQSKLKLVKNPNNEGVSLAIQKKGVNMGVLKHSPKHQQQHKKIPGKSHITGFKIISKHANVNQQQKTAKLVQPQPLASPKAVPSTPTPTTPKVKTPKITPKPNEREKKTPIGKEKSTPSAKEKPMPVKTPKSRQAETTPQPKQQENIRENVQKTLLEQLSNRLKMVDDLKVPEEELKGISNEIESQLYKCFGDTGQKYRNKYRSLIFNIKDVKNQTLWRRICEKSVNPYQLVRLSSDDLASQELALWREREAKHQLDMIKKSELELLNCSRQYVLKTHKGEQILEDNRPKEHMDNAEVITSLTEGTKTADESKQELKDSEKRSTSKHRHKDRDREKLGKEKSDGRDHRNRRSSSRDRDRSRKRSRSRDRSRDRSSKHKKRSRSRDRDRHRKSSHKSSKHKKDSHISSNSTTDKLDKKSKEILEQLVDSKIVPPLEDRLWKHVPQDDIVPAALESDSDHEPSSTVTIPTPPRSCDQDEDKPKEIEEDEIERSTSPLLRRPPEEIWRGTINMIDVAQICITAHEVSGDCSGLGTELPPNLDIVGRISPETVWDYIGKMRCSNSKVISLVRLNAVNIEEKMPYLALYSYLSSRNRLGVVKSVNKAVKDFYILPLASQKPIPQALLPISGPGFEESRPALLLGIIVRDKRKRPALETSATTASSSTSVTTAKRTRVETPPLPPTMPSRSYTPPPSKDPRLKLPLPPVLPPVPPVVVEDDVETKADDDDEPYSPEDSDPDSSTVAPDIPTMVPPPVTTTKYIGSSTPPQPFPSYTPKIEAIPGLDVTGTLPANTEDIETHLAEINKKIAESKSEICSISKNIASTDLGTTALASIALPSNLQQILDSIKTIVPPGGETEEQPPPPPPEPMPGSSGGSLTIPLILPNKFSRPLSGASTIDLTADTIPLKLPKSRKSSRVNSPLISESEKSSSVLSSLSEDDLIRKAAEMLGEDSDTLKKKETSESRNIIAGIDTSLPPPPLVSLSIQPTLVKTLQPDAPSSKRPRVEPSQPPIPGLEHEML